MPIDGCAAVQTWFLQAEPGVPPWDLVTHVQQCPTCQINVLALLANHQDLPVPERLSCEACVTHVPIFLDCERTAGASAAAQRYPALWWHLWQCPDCAEIYHGTASLLAATDAQLLPIPVLAAPPPISLPRAFLHAVFAPYAAAGAAWQHDQPRHLIAQEELAGGRLEIYATAYDALHITVELQLVPPRDNLVLISLGETVLATELVAGHSCEPLLVPTVWLIAAHGPDLVISLE